MTREEAEAVLDEMDDVERGLLLDPNEKYAYSLGDRANRLVRELDVFDWDDRRYRYYMNARGRAVRGLLVDRLHALNMEHGYACVGTWRYIKGPPPETNRHGMVSTLNHRSIQ